MDFPTAIKTCLAKATTCSGRASRSEYWWFYLFCVLVAMALLVIDIAVLNMMDEGPLSGIFWLAFYPYWTASIRRLHDVNWRPTVVYISYAAKVVITCQPWFFPFPTAEEMEANGVGSSFLIAITAYAVVMVIFCIFLIIFFIQTLRKGTASDNRFGADPLAPQMIG